MVKNLPGMRETWVWTLVRKIPWRRKWQTTPVFLPGKSHGQRNLVGYSLGSQRVRHDWATKPILYHLRKVCCCSEGELVVQQQFCYRILEMGQKYHLTLKLGRAWKATCFYSPLFHVNNNKGRLVPFGIC